ncbi:MULTISPECIES: TonB-dependent siderophore receptor [unclassified Nitratiruptor]|uniref:TonB-dependent receptor plug domain-containing protein n=1 Tax=unclassified Nitratiruptor TaxID=2624044 RepID=UPI0019151BEF|nr:MULTISPECIES: TonB-dependent receptor [unclassified Nitratiruptor]BCD59825.1 iron complex outermembrane recepter protein [Nitratiruptor sp. YY08-10]BCD63749.1 iron complex outermembrane recepter protein [Nitratiruptor sp. YY08-14]
MLKRMLFAFIFPSFLFSSDTQTIEQDFLATLNEASEIASATKLNIDKTPSTVTVLRKDFIKNTGAKTLFDLMCYIPGIETSITSSGKKQIIVRGVKNSYRDKIKFLINGVEVTNNIYTNQFYYYNFPADLIKRIEFTKTPDSVRYGDNAFLGVINIITLDESDEDLISTYYSNKNRYAISAFKSIITQHGTLLLDLHKLYSKPDLLAPVTLKIDTNDNSSTIFRQPVPAHTLEKNDGLGLTYKYNNWTLQYRLQYYKKGNFFGISRVPPFKRDQFVHLQHQFIDIGYQQYLTNDWKIETNAGYKYYIWNGAFRVYPFDLDPTSEPDKDLIVGGNFAEKEFYAKANIKYLSQKHNIQFHLETSYAKPSRAYYLQYVPALGNYAHLPGPIKTDIHRSIFALGIEDLYFVNDNFTLTGGIRFDHYNEFDWKLSAKAGLVYNFDPNNTMKCIYNSAFRAPSWVELYANTAAEFNGNESLRPEYINLLELQYIKKFASSDVLKTNFYYGKTKDTIDRFLSDSGLRIYENLGDYLIRGVEVSYTKLFENVKLILRYARSFNKREYQRSPNDQQEYLGIRKDIFSTSLDYDWNHLHSHTMFKLSSTIDTPKPYPDIPSCLSLNQIFTYSLENLDIQFGVKNLTNHKNYAYVTPSELIQNRYRFSPQELAVPLSGREWFFRIRKSF